MSVLTIINKAKCLGYFPANQATLETMVDAADRPASTAS